MIITKLIGGLGNQLFQYAVGRQLAYNHNTILKLDISDFDNYPKRHYILNHLNIIENIASSEETTAIKQTGQVIKEEHFHFDNRIPNAPDNSYLDGYWQSEKYFSIIANIIHQEFTPKYAIADKNAELAQYMNSCNSVSIHIRRDDYVNDQAINAQHGTCDLDYYSRCINEIVRVVAKPHFFVFSDDPSWARSNLHIKHPLTIVTHNGPERDYEDLRLMSMCKHNIIANSSFSWWGAWLNTNPGKMVLAPARWFNNMSIDTNDLIPASWEKVGLSPNRVFKVSLGARSSSGVAAERATFSTHSPRTISSSSKIYTVNVRQQ